VDPGTEEGWRVIDAAVRSARARLGEGLLSAYAIGSLAHGGFAVAVSDVDLALLTDRRPGRDMRAIAAAITDDVAADVGLALHDRLSVFHVPWERFAVPSPDARFPPIDRYDLVRYGVLVDGAELRDAYATAPSADQIRAQAVESALRRVTPEALATEVRALADDGVGVHDATKLVLWPVRLQHVCDAGEASGNHAAVEHYARVPDARHRQLVTDALGWRARSEIPNPDTVLQRITAEIHDLNAEIFLRLSQQPGVPRRSELARRARQIALG
jgi:predicted nucleotidyltransferase